MRKALSEGFGVSARVVAGVWLAATATGCSRWAERPPYNRNGFSNYSTLGNDFQRVPKGQTIPPAGFGVDLVGTGARQNPGDQEVIKAHAEQTP